MREYYKGKVKNEQEDNEMEDINSRGSPVIYGQKIVLKHVYSGNYLNLDPMKLAKENGCIEVRIFNIELTNFPGIT